MHPCEDKGCGPGPWVTIRTLVPGLSGAGVAEGRGWGSDRSGRAAPALSLLHPQRPAAGQPGNEYWMTGRWADNGREGEEDV